MTSSGIDALVTGATRGVGRAMAERLAQRGPTIGTARAPMPDDNSGIEWATLDVRSASQQQDLAAALTGRPLRLLVCNAGIYADKGHQMDNGYGEDLWADTFATNVTGVFLTIRNLLPNLEMESGGKIAIISSQMGSSTLANGGGYIYRASKAAALNLGMNLASDLKDRGIAVGIYHPGWVQTDMGGGAAEITVDQAADGLLARFDALSLNTTGCFETWDGRAHPA